MNHTNYTNLEKIIRSTGFISDVVMIDESSKFNERCSLCGISGAVKDITLDNSGVCNKCRNFERYKEQVQLYFGEESDLEKIFENNREKRRSDFDCLLLFSGGKDSTYALYWLVNKGYKVKTYTFDNGFISRQALKNIERITSELNVPHITETHNEMKAVFRESLTEKSSVCNGCFKGLLDLSLIHADEMNINLVITGLSRGQIVNERLTYLHQNNIFEPEIIDKKLEAGRKIFHQVESYSGLNPQMFGDGSVFDRVSLIDIYRYVPVTKPQIYDALTSNKVLWSEPSDTGMCSSNCMINDVGIYVHNIEKGYSNYEEPTAWEVRLGHLEREAAVLELEAVVGGERIKRILKSINYNPIPAVDLDHQKITAYCQLNNKDVIRKFRETVTQKISQEQALLPNLVYTEEIKRKENGEPDIDSMTFYTEESIQTKEGYIDLSETQINLTHAQLDLLSQYSLEECPWNGRQFDTTESLNEQDFRRSLLQVLLHHDALRLRLQKVDGVWRQTFPISAKSLPLNWIDLSKKSPGEQVNKIDAFRVKLHQRLKPSSEASLIRVFVFDKGESQGSTILIFANSLLMDEVSWMILTDDLSCAYDACRSGKLVNLADKKDAVNTILNAQVDDDTQSQLSTSNGKTSLPCDIVPTQCKQLLGHSKNIHQILDTIAEELYSVKKEEGLHWAVMDHGRAKHSWKALGCLSTIKIHDVILGKGLNPTKLENVTKFNFCASVLPTDAPSGNNGTIQIGNDFINHSYMTSWIVLRTTNDGIQLTYSAVPQNENDQALSQAVDKACQ